MQSALYTYITGEYIILSRSSMAAGYADASDPYAISSAEWNAGPGWTVQYVPRYAVPLTSFDRPASGAKARAQFPVLVITLHEIRHL